MAKITRFDRTNLKTLRTDIDHALQAVLKKHGLSGGIGRITFDANEFRSKLTVTTGSNDDAAEREFANNAFRFGLTGKEFGKKFTQGRDTFVITGIKPKSFKYPILAKRADGKVFKFPASAAKTAV